MYSKELLDDSLMQWAIFDPDMEVVCIVIGKEQADSLISHLNRTKP